MSEGQKQALLVLTNNGIDEEGTHEELIALDGTYASLYNMQLRFIDPSGAE